MLKNFHFVKNKNIAVIIVAAVLVIGILSFIIRGFNIDIDFSGGTEIQIDLGVEVTKDVCESVNGIVGSSLGNEYVSSTVQSKTSNTMAVIRTGTKALDTKQQDDLIKALAKVYPDADFSDDSNFRITMVAPIIGVSTTQKALLAVGIALVLMLAYIWVRFELLSGIASVACLAHDLFVMLVVYSLFQIPINANIIAAFLTILGYSINATIIIFDRIRANNRRHKEDMAFEDIVDKSIHQTLRRSIFTTVTTLLTIGMIFILGEESIRNFALPLCIGIIAGLFSSCCLAGMLWSELSKVIKPKKAKAAK